MNKPTKLILAAMSAMVALSFVGLAGFSFAGISVFVGLIAFFLNQRATGKMFAATELDFHELPKKLNHARVWLWILLPVAMNIASNLLALQILPAFITHVKARASAFVSPEALPLMIVQLIVLALGEEIAWRAFFQKQAQRLMPFPAALVATSLLFALGHIAKGSPAVVAYDVLIVFINSMIYGIVFKKTDSAWISTLSHLIANLSAFVMLSWI